MMHEVYNPNGLPESASVVAIGNFDGVHVGHQALLARLIESAGKFGLPAVVLTFEPHPRCVVDPLHSPMRLTPFREKIRLLASGGVDKIVVAPFNQAIASLSGEDFFHAFLDDRLHVRHLVVGDDFRFGARRRFDIESLRNGTMTTGALTMDVVPGVCINGERVSSTRIRELLGKGQLKEARVLLGRPFFLSGRVRSGRRLGRKLGFPTANLKVGRDGIPLSGVFAVDVVLNTGERFHGIANVGSRPTIGDNQSVNVEVHVLDFDRSLYGERICVYFLKKLRAERRFESLTALQAAIAEDKAQTYAYFNDEAYQMEQFDEGL